MTTDNFLLEQLKIFIQLGLYSASAHTLQLAINNALTIEESNSVVKKASELVSAFRNSYIRTAALDPI